MRSTAGFAAGALLGVAVALVAGRLLHAPATPELIPVPDSGGRVTAVLFHYDPSADPIALRPLLDIVGALDAATEVTVAVRSPAHFAVLLRRLEAAGLAARPVHPLVVGRSVTPWSRDRFLSARRGGRVVLIVPRPVPSAIPGRAEDPAVPWTLAALRSPGIEAAEAPVTFDGGDLVADESRVYLTPAAARRDPTGAGGDARAIRDALAAVLDRDVLLLADDPADAPDHHIGMFVTPLGRGTVLVGDPRAARGLLTGTAAALVPDADLSDASAARFDAAAESLGRAGLRVLRIPLVPTHTPYVWLGYNNVLIDDRADGRHVLLPQYDVPSLDRAGRTAWEDLGFVVHPIDVSRLYRHGGAVRCLAAVLSRDPAPERAGAPTRFAAPIRTAGR